MSHTVGWGRRDGGRRERTGDVGGRRIKENRKDEWLVRASTGQICRRQLMKTSVRRQNNSSSESCSLTLQIKQPISFALLCSPSSPGLCDCLIFSTYLKWKKPNINKYRWLYSLVSVFPRLCNLKHCAVDFFLNFRLRSGRKPKSMIGYKVG